MTAGTEVSLWARVEGAAEAPAPEGVDGVVLGPQPAGEASRALAEDLPRVILDRPPEAYGPEATGALFCLEGLEATARARDASPEHPWLPRLVLERARPRYNFPTRHAEEGFRYYVPDTAAIGRYRDRWGENLDALLARAEALGFDQMLLHAPAAEQAGRGYDLDLLERAAARFAGALWLSGGAREPRHLGNLVRSGGAAVAVVTDRVLQETGVAAWRAALTPPVAGEPVRFAGTDGTLRAG